MKKETKDNLHVILNNGEIDKARQVLMSLIREDADDDELHYMMGNVWAKTNDWQKALESYNQALELNPESPASEAKEMIMDILVFFDKERYNV